MKFRIYMFRGTIISQTEIMIDGWLIDFAISLRSFTEFPVAWIVHATLSLSKSLLTFVSASQFEEQRSSSSLWHHFDARKSSMLFTAQLESSKSRNNETIVNTPCVCVPRRYVKEHIVVAILVRPFLSVVQHDGTKCTFFGGQCLQSEETFLRNHCGNIEINDNHRISIDHSLLLVSLISHRDTITNE